MRITFITRLFRFPRVRTKRYEILLPLNYNHGSDIEQEKFDLLHLLSIFDPIDQSQSPRQDGNLWQIPFMSNGDDWNKYLGNFVERRGELVNGQRTNRRRDGGRFQEVTVIFHHVVVQRNELFSLYGFSKGGG